MREAPLTREEVDALPRLLSGYPYELPTPYREEAFVVPESYREFLLLHREVRLEHQPDGEEWETYRPVLLEDNDYEALTGHYVDDGEWLDSNAPLTFGFDSFEAWFTRLCAVVRREDLELDDFVAVGNAMVE